jgi:molecular chaperone GrpE (heat shock protein)
MKATLEYNLPDEQEEFQDAVNGAKWKYAMWVMDNELRALTKYAPDSMPDEVHKAYEGTRDKLHSLLTEHDLSL